MKLFNRIIFIIIILIMVVSCFSAPCYAADGLTEQQQAYLRQYVITYVTEGVNPASGRGSWFIYDQAHNKEKSYHNQASSSSSRVIAEGKYGDGYTDKIAYCCASFCVSMLYQSIGAPLLERDKIANIRGTGFFNPQRNNAFFRVDDSQFLQPGDVIIGTGYRWHAMLYIGMDPATGKHQIAQTGGPGHLMIKDIDGEEGKPITAGKLQSIGGKVSFKGGTIDRYGEVSRLNPDILPTDWDIEMPIEITWPDGSVTVADGQLILTNYGDSGELWYQGIAELDYEGREKNWAETLVESLGDILDYIVGLVTYAFRLPVIGVAVIAETLMNWILQIFSTTGTLKVITLEDIIFNRVPLLNINLISDISQQNLSQDGFDIIQFLHSGILTWYYIFRYIVIIGMLLTLIYMGVKLAITAIAEEKAKYKRMLLDWLVSFIIVFIIHFYIVIIISANEFVLGIFEKQLIESVNNSDALLTTGSLFKTIRNMMYSLKLSEGWMGVFAFLLLVYYTIKFAIKYLIRMFNVYILMLLSPLVAMSYSVDKIKDGKSQSLKKWMKELGFGVMVQSIHAFIYTMFITLIISQIETTNIFSFGLSIVLMFVTFNFMEKAENLFESIFSIKSDSITSTNITPEEAVKSITSSAAVRGWVRGYGVIAKQAYKRVKPVMTAVVQKTGIDKINRNVKAIYDHEKYGDDEYSKDDEEIQKEKAARKKQEEKLKEKRSEMWGQVKEVVSDFAKAIPALAESPMTGLTLILSGVVAIRKHNLTIKKYKSNMKLNSKVDMYETVKLMNKQKQLQRQIAKLDANVRSNPNTIIGRGEQPNATLVEQAKAKQANIILIDTMKLEYDRIDSSLVDQAVNEIILEEDGKIDGSMVERIAEKVKEKGKQRGIKNINDAQLEESINVAILRNNSPRRTKNKTNSDLSFEIKKEKEKLKKELEEKARTTKMSKKEKRENVERALKADLESYIREQQKKNQLLQGIKENEITNLVMEALNSQGSVINQRYGEKIKSTSNEKSNIGGTETKNESQSNVDMKKGKTEGKNQNGNPNPQGGKNATVALKSEELTKLQEEVAPILETVRELRQVEEKLQQHKIKTKDNIGSIIHAREKAQQRSNVKGGKSASNERKNNKGQDKKESKKRNTKTINFKT